MILSKPATASAIAELSSKQEKLTHEVDPRKSVTRTSFYASTSWSYCTRFTIPVYTPLTACKPALCSLYVDISQSALMFEKHIPPRTEEQHLSVRNTYPYVFRDCDRCNLKSFATSASRGAVRAARGLHAVRWGLRELP